MNKLRSILLASICTSLLTAQKTSTPSATAAQDPPRVTHIVRLKYADPRKVKSTTEPLIRSVAIEADDVLRLVLVSGRESEVHQIEQTIHELDAGYEKASRSSIRLTTYVLGASEKGQANDTTLASLQAVIKQLKAIFPYRSYKLLETLESRSSVSDISKNAGTLQPLDSAAAPYPVHYSSAFRVTSLSGDASKATIHLDLFSFKANFAVTDNPAQAIPSESSIDTSFDINEGQKVVIGKSGIPGGTIFLIVEAEVIR